MKPDQVKIVEVDHHNVQVLLNLLQAYEGEFSAITSKTPNAVGLFPLDSNPEECLSFIFYIEGQGDDSLIPVGFAMKSMSDDIVEFKEFYVVPALRKKGISSSAMKLLFQKFPGVWHIKTLLNADHAHAHWSKLISRFQNEGTVSDLKHIRFKDPYWGEVNLITFQV